MPLSESDNQRWHWFRDALFARYPIVMSKELPPTPTVYYTPLLRNTEMLGSRGRFDEFRALLRAALAYNDGLEALHLRCISGGNALIIRYCTVGSSGVSHGMSAAYCTRFSVFTYCTTTITSFSPRIISVSVL